MTTDIETECVIVGGGPAGLMTALLLLRDGVDVTVVEKHADFLCDFRGDTIHPSTQDLLGELGLLDEFLARPHADMDRVTLSWLGTELVLADFAHLPTRRRTMTFMPQWDFLDLLAETCSTHPGFRLLRSTRIDGLIRDGGRIVGVTGTAGGGDVSVRARLVIDASGRDSVVRRAAGLTPVGVAAAMDVLWFRLPKRPGERYPFIQAGAGMVIAIDRDAFFQIARVIPAGTWDGSPDDIARMKRRVAVISPMMRDAVASVSVEDVHVLKVRLERLPHWSVNGLLCIGDAAHAMSPAGGVGVNLAVQDAVAAARILGPVLREKAPLLADLRRVQRRREWPARVTQAVQRRLQGPLLSTREPGTPLPLPLRILRRFPTAARVTGRLVGMGVRPEHIGDGARSGRMVPGPRDR